MSGRIRSHSAPQRGEQYAECVLVEPDEDSSLLVHATWFMVAALVFAGVSTLAGLAFTMAKH